jgi:hypothetical protein
MELKNDTIENSSDTILIPHEVCYFGIHHHSLQCLLFTNKTCTGDQQLDGGTRA